jgi:hypothetical protein
MQAHGKRLEGYQWVAAWHVCHVMNMFIKKGSNAVQPGDLMGQQGKTKLSRQEVQNLRKQKWLENLGLPAPEIERIDEPQFLIDPKFLVFQDPS